MEEIKKVLGTEKLIIGLERTMKALRKGELSKVFLASNAPTEAKGDLEHYKAISGLKVEELDMDNEELGALCRKPFQVSVLGLKK